MSHKYFHFLIGFLIVGSIFFTLSKYNNKQTIKTVVTDKERITTSGTDGNIQSYYLIFTDAGTFKLEDDIIYGNFNSSDWYGRIKRDSAYTFDVVGYRIGFMSEYPNIVNFR